MPSCQNCGSFMEEGVRVCPFCGKQITEEEIEMVAGQTEEGRHSDKEVIFAAEPESVIGESLESYSEKEGRVIVHPQGEELEDNYVFHTPDIETMGLETAPQREILQPRALEAIPLRNFLNWLAIGILSLGIGFLIYLYLNIEDLEKHSHYPNEPKAKPIDVSASSLLLLFFIAICFLFIPILWWIYYKKYASLYYHLKDQDYETAPVKSIHPIIYLVPLICSHLLALIPNIISLFVWRFYHININIMDTIPALFWSIVGVELALSAILLVMDFQWQKAFNFHSKIVMRNFGVSFRM